MWVLNTNNESKFSFNWSGPATVLERRGHVVYKIKFENGNERLYHINMLKPFIDRATVNQVAQNIEDKEIENVNDENVDEAGISAAVMGLIEDSDWENDEDQNVCDVGSNAIRLEEPEGKMNIASKNKTETYKDGY